MPPLQTEQGRAQQFRGGQVDHGGEEDRGGASGFELDGFLRGDVERGFGESRLEVADDAQDASYFAASERIASFS